MSYLELLKKLGNTQNGNPQNHQNPFEAGSEGFDGSISGTFQNSEPDHALSLPGDISPGRGGSEGFEGTSEGRFENFDSPPDTSPANENSNELRIKGLSAEHSERLVRMLAERSDFDDRRSCAECRSYIAGLCMKRLQPVGASDDIALVLHRCAGFSRDMAAMFQGGAGK